MENLSKKMIASSSWAISLRLTDRMLGLVSTLVLVRILMPEDFGVVAMATAVIAVLQLMHSFGFDSALIQNQKTEQYHFDTVWTIRIILYSLMSALIIVAAVPLSHFYNEPRLVPIMYALAIGWFVQGFENIGIVMFQKNLEFNKEFKLGLYKKLSSVLITIPLALYLRSYWALVIGMVSSRVIGVILSYMLHEMRPRFCLKAMSEVFNFTKWIFLTNLLYVTKMRFPEFLLGGLLGARTLGLYTVAYEISSLPSSELTAPINRAMLPAYSTISDSAEMLKQQYLNVLSVILLAILPVCFGLAATAEYLVPILLGERWLDATPLIQMLAFYGAVTVSSSNISPALVARGKPKKVAILSLIYITFSLPIIFYMTKHYNEIGTVLSMLITSLMILPLSFGVVIKELSIPLKEFFIRTYRPIVAVFIMYYLLTFLIKPDAGDGSFFMNLSHLLTMVVSGAIIYTSTIFMLWKLHNSPQDCAEWHIYKLARNRLIRPTPTQS